VNKSPFHFFVLFLVSLSINLGATNTNTCVAVDNNDTDYAMMEDEIRDRIMNMNSLVGAHYNSTVRSYMMTYFVKDRVKATYIISKMQVYFPMIERALAERNMPDAIKYLAVTESALNPKATSRSGAAGLWQFMRPTAKDLRLRMTSYEDDRRHPEKSTEAALEYLTWLYKKFGDWKLAFAAYNGGPGRVNSAIRKAKGSKDFWVVKKFLPRETRNYVSAFLAAEYLCNYYAHHDLNMVHVDQDLIYTAKTKIYSGMSLTEIANKSSVDYKIVRQLNPSYIRNYIPKSSYGREVVLPENAMHLFTTNINRPDAPVHSNYNVSYAGLNAPSGDYKYENRKIKHSHFVVKGENLYRLAGEFDCRVSDLKNWNNLKSDKLRIGQKIDYYMMEKVLVKAPTPTRVTYTKPKVAPKPKPVVKKNQAKFFINRLPSVNFNKHIKSDPTSLSAKVNYNKRLFAEDKDFKLVNRRKSLYDLAKANQVSLDYLIEVNRINNSDALISKKVLLK
jgi:membrane-bound lytic murein transglycosylase D